MEKKIFMSSRWIFGIIIPQLVSSGCVKKDQPENGKPNFIVIIADDTGWNDVGYNGSEILTPVIDQLADEGIRFDRFYVSPVCSPTRASLLTGRYPSRYGITGALGDEPGIPPGTTSLAELLRQGGYETLISGKWHLGAVPEARPKQYGFDISYGYLRGQIDPYTHLYKDGQRTWHRNDTLTEDEGHATDLITDEVISYLKTIRNKNKPFFIYAAYSVPHYPLEEPEEWTNLYAGTIENKSRRLFAASMTHMDHCIGEILNALSEEGIEEQTIVLFLSDNGGQKSWRSDTEYGGKFEPNDVLGDNTPLRGWKAGIYEGGIRVPAVMIWPGQFDQRLVTEYVNVVDILPFFAGLAGIEVPDELEIDGIDFLPAVEGNPLPENRTMYWKRSDRTHVLIKDKWKLVYNGIFPDQGRGELYNLFTDPAEENDVSGKFPGIVEDMKHDLRYEMKKDSLSWEKYNIK